MAEVVVVHKELRLQNVQPVEFGEQISRGIRSRGKRIVRMRLGVVGESLVRRRELQIVHLQVTQFEARGGASYVDGQQQGQRGNGGLNHVETITTLDILATAALLVPMLWTRSWGTAFP